MGVQQQVPQPPKLPRPTRPVSEARRIRKPLMEKKRRERINNSLTDLANLLTEARLVKVEGGGKAAKLEKADILELTVTHLHNLKKQKKMESADEKKDKENGKSVGAKGGDVGYTEGYRQCINVVDGLLKSYKDLAAKNLRQRLLEHLQSCLKKEAEDQGGSDQENKREDKVKNINDGKRRITEVTSSTCEFPSSREQPMEVEEDKGNKEVEKKEEEEEEKVEEEEEEEAKEQKPLALNEMEGSESTPTANATGLTLIPTRLPGGGFAFLLQGGLDALLPTNVSTGPSSPAALPPTPPPSHSPIPSTPEVPIKPKEELLRATSPTSPSRSSPLPTQASGPPPPSTSASTPSGTVTATSQAVRGGLPPTPPPESQCFQAPPDLRSFTTARTTLPGPYDSPSTVPYTNNHPTTPSQPHHITTSTGVITPYNSVNNAPATTTTNNNYYDPQQHRHSPVTTQEGYHAYYHHHQTSSFSATRAPSSLPTHVVYRPHRTLSTGPYPDQEEQREYEEGVEMKGYDDDEDDDEDIEVDVVSDAPCDLSFRSMWRPW